MEATSPSFIVAAICIHFALLVRAVWWHVTSVRDFRGEKILYLGLMCLLGGAFFLLPIARAIALGFENTDLRLGAEAFAAVGFRYYVAITTLSGALWAVGLYCRRQ